MPETPAQTDARAPDQPDLTPIVASARTPGEVIEALGTLSKRGKLAGFEKLTEEGGAARFRADAQGTPFDRELIGHVHPAGAADEPGSRIEWTLRMPRKMPAIFAAALIISVWPGLPLTDSMLVTYSSWYSGLVSDGWFRTWMWYLPLTVPFLPLAWRGAMKKSRTSSLEHAREVVEKIATALGAPHAH